MSFTKSQLEKYADVIIWGLETARTKKFRPYDIINLRFETDALPLAETVSRKLIQMKMNVFPRSLLNPVMEKNFYEYSDKKQRAFIGKWEDNFAESMNGNILLSAPASLTHLKSIDPKRINETAIARKRLRKIMEKREEQGLFSWTLCTYPTMELAKQAGLTIKDYTGQIIKACLLDSKDPIAKWKEIYAESGAIKKWLGSMPIKTIHVESNSCDLKIALGEKRRFLGISGHNIPSFEIFTSPDWRGTEGRYYANLPSFRTGNIVEGVSLDFKKGEIVKAGAEKGEAFLKKMIEMDRGSKRIGEFSMTDRRFSRINRFMADTLFDENFGGKFGNCHLAIGASYSDTYSGKISELTQAKKTALGFNDSALHWDLVNTEDKSVSAVLAGGKKITVYEHGMFKY